MPSQYDCGMALVENDDMNNPSRIQFTNGNVTKYIYSATGEKLRTVHQTAVPNITVAVGTAHELTASELLYADSTDYYHGGKAVRPACDLVAGLAGFCGPIGAGISFSYTITMYIIDKKNNTK